LLKWIWINVFGEFMTKRVFSVASFYLFMSLALNPANADDDEFVPAYQNVESFAFEDPNKYFAHKRGRLYYTSGKKNGFRINENNEESTDETIGILTFLLSPAALVYMNVIGWWD